mmetsp:Transcript_56580/g.132741  ORF Transcript_56580/g.132741 Transcript_56580/m.132741 type:complete len:411 (+) Transcript_56580:94-1326(+)
MNASRGLPTVSAPAGRRARCASDEHDQIPSPEEVQAELGACLPSAPKSPTSQLATAPTEADHHARKTPHLDLPEIYDTAKQLGHGTFSTVWRCVHRQSGEVRAIKKIDTSEVPPQTIAREISMMRLLTHRNIVHCYDVFLEGNYVNIVVDEFAGGDLIDGMHQHFKAHGAIANEQLARISRQMVSAIMHVHKLHIVHRDIKGENFLSDRPNIGDPRCHIALADFGTAVRIEPGERLSDQVGTRAYWAPEVWGCSYGQECDMWAVGVTTYVLLMGALPFNGEEDACRDVGTGGTLCKYPSTVPASCVQFLQEALRKDPGARLTAAQALQDPWLAPHASPEVAIAGDISRNSVLPDAQGAITGCLSFARNAALTVGLFSCSLLACGLEVLLGVHPSSQAAAECSAAESKATA